METAEFIEVLRTEGETLAVLADRAGWDAEVPSCPGWHTRDLVAHLGNVHRRVALYVAGATEPVRGDWEAPADAELDGWYRAGHAALVDALSNAPADLECWTFVPAASPLAFWTRRQAHEMAVHRIDAELAAGAEHLPFGASFAADGIDELLHGALSRPQGTLRSGSPHAIRVRPTDAGGRSWLLRLSNDPPRVHNDDPAPADCTVSGTADALYAALWNRSGFKELDVTGDTSLVDQWSTLAAV
ncbi:maleylpyruvate isomerase family mycothiol-dependent enzyme [Streptantibioticus silvisoli]|uniref:Maleylpyruvate isomerase family mycothiol-dependent enzyme n=1 Tax=Streptantibioticus silvisoli TaxID=2705255 RepID=A0ABT6W7K8_9ACTN|nr:maleylpyruvate isomerase family mycothiol-dependent enzyme [Streptantibioticus silvisoli]MDI5966734.1 maleylpyruvate isomerase family mycothiol-dependent enzyme [Streptantibioticus silvisoli]